MGADHSFYVKTIETHARAFLPLNISAVGTVLCQLTISSHHFLVGATANPPKYDAWKWSTDKVSFFLNHFLRNPYFSLITTSLFSHFLMLQIFCLI
jgi:hypothetical protein